LKRFGKKILFSLEEIIEVLSLSSQSEKGNPEWDRRMQLKSFSSVIRDEASDKLSDFGGGHLSRG